jgi:hypothetical protein
MVIGNIHICVRIIRILLLGNQIRIIQLLIPISVIIVIINRYLDFK